MLFAERSKKLAQIFNATQWLAEPTRHYCLLAGEQI